MTASFILDGITGGWAFPYTQTSRNYFAGFRFGIYIIDAGTKVSSIKFADFEYNGMSIYANLANNIKILSCNIDISSSPIPSSIQPNYNGINIFNSSQYVIENNQIYGKGNGIGIDICNSGEGYNTIKYNTFYNHCTANYIHGINGNGSNSEYCIGLQYLCNRFFNNGSDIEVSYNSSIRLLQGSIYGGTGNEFAGGSLLNFANLSPNIITYFYNGTKSNHEPIRYHYANRFTPIEVNKGWCSSAGILGDNYYLLSSYSDDIIGLGTMYEEKISILNKKKSLYNERYSFPIDWNEIHNGGNDFILNPQIKSYIENSDLQEEIGSICRNAFDIILSNEIFDRNEYNTWLERENTLNSFYLLAESHFEASNLEKAESTLQELKVRFPHYPRFRNRKKVLFLHRKS